VHGYLARSSRCWQLLALTLSSHAAAAAAAAAALCCRFVGVSRITDFKHHASDVVGGALLGTLFGLAFVVRSIARLGSVVDVPIDLHPGTGSPQSELLGHNGGGRDTGRVHASSMVPV
jgi:hypothetical protein